MALDGKAGGSSSPAQSAAAFCTSLRKSARLCGQVGNKRYAGATTLGGAPAPRAATKAPPRFAENY